MLIVAVAWMFVVVLMAVAEATSTQGSLLGAFFTFVLYGVLPLSVVLYLMATPARRARQRRHDAVLADASPDLASPGNAQATVDSSSVGQGDAGGEPAGAPITPVGKKV